MRGSTLLVPLALLAAAPAEAQEEMPLDRACGEKAGVYGADKPFRLWVTRQGTMLQDNPLRPLGPDELIVLQVVVNGRVATAIGPDWKNLRQGRSPQALEADSKEPIRWAPATDPLPDAVRIVGEDGTVQFGPLRFLACEDAPKAAAVAGGKRPARGGSEAGQTDGDGGSPGRGRTRREAPAGFSLPRGALQ